MRGSLVVLALVASPFLAASAQGHSPKRTLVPVGAKCTVPARGNSADAASQTGLQNRADPTQRGNKDCPAPQSGGGSGGATVGHSFVTGMLFNDPNAVGAYDGSQFGLAGWTVQLTGPSGTLTAVTDGNGNYSFSSLDAGSYTLCVVPPAGWINTAPSAGVTCPGSSYGYTIDAPAGLSFDVYFSDYNFGFQSAPW
jgi:hypothetical protein